MLNLFSLFSLPSSHPRTLQRVWGQSPSRQRFWCISDTNGAFEAIEICLIILFYINNSSNHTAKISVPFSL